ncbi:hypothetical protein ABEM33_22710 [Escherichia coli]
MTNLKKHADLIILLDQQPELIKLFLRVLWKTLALPPEDELWKDLAAGFSEMCEKTHHKRLINMLESHKDFFEPALTALYRQEPPEAIEAVMLSDALRRSNQEVKDFHHDLQELTDQMRDILHR